MAGQIEIIFPLADVDDPATRAWYVDGGANQSYGPGTPSGQFGAQSRPHQIGTDAFFPDPDE